MSAEEFELDVEMTGGPACGLQFSWPQGRSVILIRCGNEVYAYVWQAKTSPAGRWVYKARGPVAVMGQQLLGYLAVIGQKGGQP